MEVLADTRDALHYLTTPGNGSLRSPGANETATLKE